MAGTFDVDVPGIGAFQFRERTMRDQFRIEGEASRMLGGPVPDDLLQTGAISYATVIVLMHRQPEGFDITALSPFDAQGSAVTLFKIHEALREAEDKFCPGAKSQREKSRNRDEQNDGVPLSPPVRDAAD